MRFLVKISYLCRRNGSSHNTELLRLYWRMGADICENQKSASWGDGWLKDQFYNEQLTIGQQLVAQLDDVNMQQLVAQLQDKDFKKR